MPARQCPWCFRLCGLQRTIGTTCPCCSPRGRAPFLDPHEAGLNQVHSLEEAGHLLAVAGRELLPHHLALHVLKAVLRFLAEEVRRQVGQGEIAQVGVDVVGGTRLAPGKQRAGVGETTGSYVARPR